MSHASGEPVVLVALLTVLVVVPLLVAPPVPVLLTAPPSVVLPVVASVVLPDVVVPASVVLAVARPAVVPDVVVSPAVVAVLVGVPKAPVVVPVGTVPVELWVTLPTLPVVALPPPVVAKGDDGPFESEQPNPTGANVSATCETTGFIDNELRWVRWPPTGRLQSGALVTDSMGVLGSAPPLCKLEGV